MGTDAETTVMWPPAQGHLGPQELEAAGGTLLWSLQREPNPEAPGPRTFGLQDVRESTSAASAARSAVICYRRPRTLTDPPLSGALSGSRSVGGVGVMEAALQG